MGNGITGTVIWGVNNIYTVQSRHGAVECRFKGKVLHGKKDAYNPLAPGDLVEFELIKKTEKTEGLILSRGDRKNSFRRWNKKRQAPQVIAANIDACFCITSPTHPPFRPRFIDRVMVMAGIEDIPVSVICNKADQEIDGEMKNRLKVYEILGYPVLSCSALKEQGMRPIRRALAGKRVLLIGQSGVGKSTLVNALVSGAGRKIGDLSDKYNRGRHTTVFSTTIFGDGFELIDTPGIREIEVFDIDEVELGGFFRDFRPFAGSCRFNTCLHDGEPDCAVKRGVEEGLIHPDRYESYLRILYDVKGRNEKNYG